MCANIIEDYEDIAVGSLPADYANDSVYPLDAFSVQTDKSHSGSKSLKCVNGAGAGQWGHWNKHYAGSYYGVWVYIESISDALQRDLTTQRVPGDYNYNKDEVTRIYTENADIKAFNGITSTLVGTATIGWHHAEFFINFNTNKYSFDWDGVRLATDFGFWCGQVDSIESFHFGFFQSGAGNMWVDELTLQAGQPYMKRIQGVPGMRTYGGI